MTEMFLGETFGFWCKVRAAMHKAKIDTPEHLEVRLGVSPPVYRVVADGEHFKIIEYRPILGHEREIGWSVNRADAERIASACVRKFEQEAIE